MKIKNILHKLYLIVVCCLTTMHICAQDAIVTMATANESVTIYVEWAGAGSIIANGVELKNDITTENVVAVTEGGSVVLVATKGVQLTHLFCYDNSLETLDVTKCVGLTNLECDNNILTALDVSNCKELTHLSYSRNNLVDLNVTKCTMLTVLYCSENPMRTLDVTNCPKLTELHCQNAFLTTLDLSNCPELTELNCWSNSLTALDVTNCPKLYWLECSYNSLSVLDVAQRIKLKHMKADYQALTLPIVKADDDRLSIKNQIVFNKSEVKIDNISHNGTYKAGNIAWEVQGESGELTFDFSAELPDGVSGRPFTGTVTQPWTKK